MRPDPTTVAALVREVQRLRLTLTEALELLNAIHEFSHTAPGSDPAPLLARWEAFNEQLRRSGVLN